MDSSNTNTETDTDAHYSPLRNRSIVGSRPFSPPTPAGSSMASVATDPAMVALRRYSERGRRNSSRSTSNTFDISATMNRLKQTMMGAPPNITTAISSDSMDDLAYGTSPLTSEIDVHVDHQSRKDDQRLNDEGLPLLNKTRGRSKKNSSFSKKIRKALAQIPAIVLIGMFHLMIGIPFGVSYFPIGWRGDSETDPNSQNQTDDDVNGLFPLPGKEALGIRMFLFSTILGQVVYTFTSQFRNPIGLQMVENVPFCHELAAICIRHQGYGLEALSTLFVLFGFASVLVGVVFYLLGHFQLGRIVYYFPNHVLVGCIGGIGIYIAKTGLEVTMNDVFSVVSLYENWNLLWVVFVFELILRILERITLDADGKPQYALLSPIYFCSITPVFYFSIWVLGISMQSAFDEGFFFPPLDACDDAVQDCTSSSYSMWSSIFNEDLLNIWKIVHVSTISIPAIVDSLPTLLALVLFSLIHVPINIPAFAISTNSEVDMNNELVSHGYSNIIAGVFAGLQNYMAYTQSVLYDKSGGTGKVSGVGVAVITSLLFLVGPAIASYIPRCMAGTLLLHVGIDLFLEGVYDSYGKFDPLEYASIWTIVIVMTLYGMEAAMVAGFVTAVFTYAAQNMAYVDPLRGSMSASTLRSSRWAIDRKAHAILADTTRGRNRILVVQLQGHLFFGNMAHLTESMKKLLSEKQGTPFAPWIVILDFCLVLGIDSSAAQAIGKLKTTMQRQFNVELSIFVTGSRDGFPTEYNLSRELSSPNMQEKAPEEDHDGSPVTERSSLLDMPHLSTRSPDEKVRHKGSRVCDTLDEALIFAEDALIARVDPLLLNDDLERRFSSSALSSESEEKEFALSSLVNLCPEGIERKHIEVLFAAFQRESYSHGDFLWRQGATSDSMKLIVHGSLIALLENEAGTTEAIDHGNTIGELGLVEGVPRMSSVQVISTDGAIVYSLSKDSFDRLIHRSPQAARIVDLICVRYLSTRVQHVSNRIFETRCLPI